MNTIIPILRIAIALSMGPGATIATPDGDCITSSVPNNVFITDVTAGILFFEHWAIEGQSLIYMAPPAIGGRDDFEPYQADFTIRTYLVFGPIKAGVEHVGYHPIVPAAYSFDQKYGGDNTVFLVYEPEF